MKRSPLKRKITPANQPTICPHCGEEFIPRANHRNFKQKHCSPACSARSQAEAIQKAYPPREEVWAAYQVEGVSDETFGKRHGHSYQWAFLVRRHYGIETPSPRDKWIRKRGGPSRWKSSTGYWFVSTPTGQEYEHRLVAERMLGRALSPEEVVHHIDGDGTNNAPENLRVYESNAAHMRAEHRRPKKPRGQRVEHRFAIRFKLEPCCRNCGMAGVLHLHHAIPRSMCRATRLELLNGLPLCIACHHGWHRKTVVIYRDVFTEEEWAFLSAVELTGQRVEAWLDRHYPDRGQPFRSLEVLAA